MAQELWFYVAKDLAKLRWDHPNGAPNSGGLGKNCVLRLVEKSAAQMPYSRKLVSIRHVGPRTRRCAGGGIRGVINNVGGSRSLLTTLTAQSTSKTLVVVKVCLLHAGYGSFQRYIICDTERRMLSVR